MYIEHIFDNENQQSISSLIIAVLRTDKTTIFFAVGTESESESE